MVEHRSGDESPSHKQSAGCEGIDGSPGGGVQHGGEHGQEEQRGTEVALVDQHGERPQIGALIDVLGADDLLGAHVFGGADHRAGGRELLFAGCARRLGQTDDNVSAFIEEALFATVTNVNFDVESLLEMVLECGRQNIRVMELLDEGHTERLGTPEPTTVSSGAIA